MTRPSRAPLWRAIADALRADIAAGRRAPGARLPTEADLAARFAVNRHTVRRALAALAEEGLVRSRRGAGAFVAARPTDYRLGRRVRFRENLEAQGRIPHRKVLGLSSRAADAREAAALGLAEGDAVLAAEGVAYADAAPLAVYRSALPPLPGLEAALAETGSITEALGRAGVPDYVRVSTRLTAVAAPELIAHRLEIEPAAPLLRADSVNADPDGRPVEAGRTWFAGERVQLVMDGA